MKLNFTFADLTKPVLVALICQAVADRTSANRETERNAKRFLDHVLPRLFQTPSLRNLPSVGVTE